MTLRNAEAQADYAILARWAQETKKPLDCVQDGTAERFAFLDS